MYMLNIKNVYAVVIFFRDCIFICSVVGTNAILIAYFK